MVKLYCESKHASEAAYDFYLKSNAVSAICIEAYMHTQNYPEKNQFTPVNFLCVGILFSLCPCV